MPIRPIGTATRFSSLANATDVLVVTSAQMMIANMVPDAPGIWLYHCHISDHMLAGMVARYEVKNR